MEWDKNGWDKNGWDKNGSNCSRYKNGMGQEWMGQEWIESFLVQEWTVFFIDEGSGMFVPDFHLTRYNVFFVTLFPYPGAAGFGLDGNAVDAFDKLMQALGLDKDEKGTCSVVHCTL